MDVFGYGTEEGSRPLLPPGTCWICDQSPQQEAMKVIDTRRNSRAGGVSHGASERKYICQPCAEEMGKAMGQVSESDHQAVVGVATELQQTVSDLRYELEQTQGQQTRVVEANDLKRMLAEAVKAGQDSVRVVPKAVVSDVRADEATE